MIHLLTLLIIALATESQTTTDDDSKRIIRGKSLEEWVKQAKSGLRLKDRQDAMQVLRNEGLSHNRKLTISVFNDALMDKETTIKSLAAAGLIKAGTPANPTSLVRLVDILEQDLSTIKPPSDEFGLVARTIRAIGALGGEKQIPVLAQTSGNKRNDIILRQLADSAVRQIEKRIQNQKNKKAKFRIR